MSGFHGFQNISIAAKLRGKLSADLFEGNLPALSFSGSGLNSISS